VFIQEKPLGVFLVISPKKDRSMLNRRELLQWISGSSLFLWSFSPNARLAAVAADVGKENGGKKTQDSGNSNAGSSKTKHILASPTVLQHPGPDGFAVSFGVNGLATGWIEWGLSAEKLDHKAIASQAGLVDANDKVLVIPVFLGDCGGAGRRIFYRPAAQSLAYQDAYHLERGESMFGPVRSFVLPDLNAGQVRVAMVNDTHNHQKTLDLLSKRIEALSPDLLVWAGDTCGSAFDTPASASHVLLSPGASDATPWEGGWASTRPLLFVPGNHDVRGAFARDVRNCLAPGAEPELPYNFALRQGPLALIGLDTGEDKPDQHPVFAGTANYESYRARQAEWLHAALERPEIRSAPWKAAFCHIPLRGLAGESDGCSLDGYAAWSGDGARCWMPLLHQAGVQFIFSGHKHLWRLDEPTADLPIQVVGGGPEIERATVIVLDASDKAISIVIQNIEGRELLRRDVAASI
jgi:acid phosphatase type 7